MLAKYSYFGIPRKISAFMSRTGSSLASFGTAGANFALVEDPAKHCQIGIFANRSAGARQSGALHLTRLVDTHFST